MTETISTVDSRAEPYRRTFRIRRREVSALNALHVAEGLRALRHALPTTTRAHHRELAHAHRTQMHAQCTRWIQVADAAAQAVFGRPYKVTDYKVSAIAQDGFNEAHKEALRDAAYRQGEHARLAVLHFMAAGHRHPAALRFLREATPVS